MNNQGRTGLHIQLDDKGWTQRGSFSDNKLPTKEGIYILTEAFEIQGATDPYVRFSRHTKNEISRRYGVKDLMIMNHPENGFSGAILSTKGTDIREIAFAAYKACN